VDLVGRDKDGNVLVLEFKRRQAQLESASQLGRYVQYFSEIGRRHETSKTKEKGTRERREGFDSRRKKAEQRKNEEMRGTIVRGGIVAPAITGDALTLLGKMGYEFFKLEPHVAKFGDGPLIAEVEHAN
jgi:RecB family endonuclease NucS